jgi:hypothetical protein
MPDVPVILILELLIRFVCKFFPTGSLLEYLFLGARAPQPQIGNWIYLRIGWIRAGGGGGGVLSSPVF